MLVVAGTGQWWVVGTGPVGGADLPDDWVGPRARKRAQVHAPEGTHTMRTLIIDVIINDIIISYQSLSTLSFLYSVVIIVIVTVTGHQVTVTGHILVKFHYHDRYFLSLLLFMVTGHILVKSHYHDRKAYEFIWFLTCDN